MEVDTSRQSLSGEVFQQVGQSPDGRVYHKLPGQGLMCMLTELCPERDKLTSRRNHVAAESYFKAPVTRPKSLGGSGALCSTYTTCAGREGAGKKTDGDVAARAVVVKAEIITCRAGTMVQSREISEQSEGKRGVEAAESSQRIDSWRACRKHVANEGWELGNPG